MSVFLHFQDTGSASNSRSNNNYSSSASVFSSCKKEKKTKTCTQHMHVDFFWKKIWAHKEGDKHCASKVSQFKNQESRTEEHRTGHLVSAQTE